MSYDQSATTAAEFTNSFAQHRQYQALYQQRFTQQHQHQMPQQVVVVSHSQGFDPQPVMMNSPLNHAHSNVNLAMNVDQNMTINVAHPPQMDQQQQQQQQHQQHQQQQQAHFHQQVYSAAYNPSYESIHSYSGDPSEDLYDRILSLVPDEQIVAGLQQQCDELEKQAMENNHGAGHGEFSSQEESSITLENLLEDDPLLSFTTTLDRQRSNDTIIEVSSPINPPSEPSPSDHLAKGPAQGMMIMMHGNNSVVSIAEEPSPQAYAQTRPQNAFPTPASSTIAGNHSSPNLVQPNYTVAPSTQPHPQQIQMQMAQFQQQRQQQQQQQLDQSVHTPQMAHALPQQVPPPPPGMTMEQSQHQFNAQRRMQTVMMQQQQQQQQFYQQQQQQAQPPHPQQFVIQPQQHVFQIQPPPVPVMQHSNGPQTVLAQSQPTMNGHVSQSTPQQQRQPPQPQHQFVVRQISETPSKAGMVYQHPPQPQATPQPMPPTPPTMPPMIRSSSTTKITRPKKSSLSSGSKATSTSSTAKLRKSKSFVTSPMVAKTTKQPLYQTLDFSNQIMKPSKDTLKLSHNSKTPMKVNVIKNYEFVFEPGDGKQTAPRRRSTSMTPTSAKFSTFAKPPPIDGRSGYSPKSSPTNSEASGHSPLTFGGQSIQPSPIPSSINRFSPNDGSSPTVETFARFQKMRKGSAGKSPDKSITPPGMALVASAKDMAARINVPFKVNEN